MIYNIPKLACKTRPAFPIHFVMLTRSLKVIINRPYVT